ncbi:EutP/PduV family microcompartment system protein [Paratractidigestivibacter sp.]|uniref:EutP/PduV family microcompartment system protein n=1 Tax=Paratractidigestivibacter sp. TaxID=2847316 RepID=UPI002ABDD327|nr:EutP/PduV family microcompartment system protein [Paratractidigestivibacter sp.]
MKKILLVGRSEAGKTTLTQALNGGVLDYKKTQYMGYGNVVIDSPGEYAETSTLARALALYTYEADCVGLLINATEPFSLYPPAVTSACNRPVIGIITKIDSPDANVPRCTHWLELAGCKEIFPVSAYSGQGIWQVLNYLKEPGDVLPFKNEEEANRPRLVLSDKYGEIGKVGAGARRYSWTEEHARKDAEAGAGSDEESDEKA